MTKLIQSIGLMLCGLATSLLVALLNVFMEGATGFNFFSLSLWYILPAGACCVGVAAASGYYFGALYLNRRPTPVLLTQMVVVAALAQFLIYYLGYLGSTFEDGTSVADVASFFEYLDVRMTSARWQGSASYGDGYELGALAYLLALIQFIGLLSGSVFVYVVLRGKQYCASCNLYLKRLRTEEKFFAREGPAFAYFNTLTKCPVEDALFASLIKAPTHPTNKPVYGAHRVDVVLSGCPCCNKQFLESKVWAYDGSDWKEDNVIYHEAAVPHGVDLRPTFDGGMMDSEKKLA